MIFLIFIPLQQARLAILRWNKFFHTIDLKTESYVGAKMHIIVYNVFTQWLELFESVHPKKICWLICLVTLSLGYKLHQ